LARETCLRILCFVKFMILHSFSLFAPLDHSRAAWPHGVFVRGTRPFWSPRFSAGSAARRSRSTTQAKKRAEIDGGRENFFDLCMWH
jgi:hypothetical protein